MRIAFFVHCFFPDHFYGTETYTLDLARHYKAWGHEVTVVSAYFQGEASAKALLSRYEHCGIPVIAIDKNRVPHTRVKETYYQEDMRSVIESVLRELRPDVVHVTHLINHTAALLEVAGELGIPTYATFTDFFGFCLNNKLEAANGTLCAGPSRSRLNCVACYLKDASRNPTSDRWMRWASRPASARVIANGIGYLRSLPGVRGGKLDGLVEDIARRPDTLGTLYNGGYQEAVAPTRFLAEAYLANGIKVPLRKICFGVDIDRSMKPARDRRPVVGYIGQITPHKGTDLLIQAFRRLPANCATLRVYGPFDQVPAFMASLRSLADGADVTFMGTFATQQMATVLRDLDLLVIPSRWYENSPLVLLNALATHTPVLVSDVAGMTEFLTPGANGDAFERANVDDLELKLRALVESRERLDSMKRVTEFARTTEAMARETLSIYLP